MYVQLCLWVFHCKRTKPKALSEKFLFKLEELKNRFGWRAFLLDRLLILVQR